MFFVVFWPTGSPVQQLELELAREPARAIQEDMDLDLQGPGGGGVGRGKFSPAHFFTIYIYVYASTLCRRVSFVF